MQVKKLSFKHHKNAPFFFKDLSFELEPGKVHSLYGKNGVGKSVLLNLLSKKEMPETIVSGEIIGNERAVLVNQRFDQMIADQFSFGDNLRFACMNRFPNLLSGLSRPVLFPEILDQFQIDLSIPVYKLSGGQRQILALLMVLQQQRDFLLLDEPTATLDEQNARIVLSFLSTLTRKNGITILMVCHDNELVTSFTTGKHLHLEMDPSGSRLLHDAFGVQ